MVWVFSGSAGITPCQNTSPVVSVPNTDRRKRGAGDSSPAGGLGVSPNIKVPQRMGDLGGSDVVSPFQGGQQGIRRDSSSFHMRIHNDSGKKRCRILPAGVLGVSSISCFKQTLFDMGSPEGEPSGGGLGVSPNFKVPQRMGDLGGSDVVSPFQGGQQGIRRDSSSFHMRIQNDRRKKKCRRVPLLYLLNPLDTSARKLI
jgi:hypothetical protein